MMQCQNCGQSSDWLGTRSDWENVGDRRAARALVECEVCGNRQHTR